MGGYPWRLDLAKEHWTVLKVLDWTRKYLKEKGIARPRLESELLLSHILGFDRVGLYLKYDMVLSSSELKRFRGMIQRRVAGEPIQYIIGFQEFWSIPFKVGPQVLIPRPETEILVEEALRLIALEEWKNPLILEVGTGCGAVAISIAKSFHSARVVATEISWQALGLARENARAQSVTSQILFVLGDLLSFVKVAEKGTFDLIMSNPPYIREIDIDKLQPEIRDFEPREAINGGGDGLDFCRQLLVDAPQYLKDGGRLVLEIGADQGKDILSLSEQIGGFKDPRIVPDYSGKSRVLIAQKSGRQKKPALAVNGRRL
ncbi:MAG: peptide chain release factor N(5)-glutamine methyltransferase [Proteobacteria bacterium]|nr:peptide chain release factor N(5)-glutamine methyltransferase [Pseudomonadota bacterium]